MSDRIAAALERAERELQDPQVRARAEATLEQARKDLQDPNVRARAEAAIKKFRTIKKHATS
jgi:hypothetical protein